MTTDKKRTTEGKRLPRDLSDLEADSAFANAAAAGRSARAASESAARAELAQRMQAIPAAPLPADWKYRQDTVPGWASTFKVPRYIVRLDAAATHGWQVRYPKGRTKMFTDGLYGTPRRAGTPRDSLKAAMQFLAAIWTGNPPVKLLPERAGKDTLTGLAGVRLVTRQAPGRNMPHWVVRVDGPIKRPVAVIYVGSEGTITDARILRALHKGRMFRLAHLDEIGRLHTLSSKDQPIVDEYLRRRRHWRDELAKHVRGKK